MEIDEDFSFFPSFTQRMSINIAPKIVQKDDSIEMKEKLPFVQANLPIEKQKEVLEEKKEKEKDEITMLDSIWKKLHNKQKKMEKKIKSSEHQHKREMPWNPRNRPKKEAGIYERTVYYERQKNRTWHTQIGDEILEDTAIWFNSINAKDHLGRSWVEPPLNMKPGRHECAIPKQIIHTYSYHTSYVTNVEMFPKYGHLFLSSSLDSTVRVWSLSGDRQCIQSYIGHSKGVCDCGWTESGKKFASCCYGKKLKLWDTDSGKVYNTAILDDIPSRLALPMKEEHAEEILVCLRDGTIRHYDFRINGDKSNVLTYKSHTKNILSITFLPGSKYFMTSSEDKFIALWEFGNTKPLYVYHENWLNEVTALAAHPIEPVVVGQLAHKEIAVFNYKDLKLSIDHERSFVGSNCESFPCRMSISPDGKFVVQGDKLGSIHVWDWKSAKMLRSYSVPNNNVISKAQWSPLHPSQIICSCYDNNLYLLD